MDDVFKDAMKQVFREAHPDLAEGFRQKMVFIQGQFKHSKTTVQSCLDGMSDPPTLVELLTAAYVVNGGVLFKHCNTRVEDNEEDSEYTKLMEEMEQLSCEAAADAAMPTDSKPAAASTEGSVSPSEQKPP